MMARNRLFRAAVAAATCIPATIAVAEGSLDYAFRSGGTTFAPLPYVLSTTFSSCSGDGVAVQPDGKILLAGACTLAQDVAPAYSIDPVVTVLRLNADGSLDTSFGNAPWPSTLHYPAIPGYQFIALGPAAVFGPASIALRSDGRVVVGGTIADATRFGADSIAVAQLDADGAYDATFGSGGIAVAAVATPAGVDNSVLSRIALDPAGNIAIAGSYFPSGANAANSDFLFGRFAADGKSATLRSHAFDVGGNFADRAEDVAVDSQGRYVVAGSVTVTDAFQECGIMRIDPATVQPDPTFADQGVQTLSFDAGMYYDDCVGVAVAAGDRVVLAANVTGSGVGVARLTASGAFDQDFGRRLLAAPGFVHRIAVQPWDGKIVLAGEALGDTVCATCALDFEVARLTADGMVDRLFTAATPGSAAGAVRIDFGFEQVTPSFQASDTAKAIAFAGHDLIVAGRSDAQSTNQSYTGQARFAVTRLSADDLFYSNFDPPDAAECRSGSVSPAGFTGRVASMLDGQPVCIPPQTFALDGYGSVSICATSTCNGVTAGCPAILHAQAGSAAFVPQGGLPAPTVTLDFSGVPGQLDPFDAPIQYSIFGLGQSCTATFSETAFAISGSLGMESDHQWGGFPRSIESVSVDGFTTTASGCLSGLINAIVAQYGPAATKSLQSSVGALLPKTYDGVDVCQK